MKAGRPDVNHVSRHQKTTTSLSQTDKVCQTIRSFTVILLNLEIICCMHCMLPRLPHSQFIHSDKCCGWKQ